MKLKIVIASAAIAMSSQAFAATDTSCNPFAPGADCNGASLGAFSIGGSFGSLRANSSAGGSATAIGTISVTSDEETQVQRVMRSLAQSVNGVIIADDEVTTELELEDDGETIAFEEDGSDDEVEGGDETLGVVPVPAAGFLLLGGLGGLMAMRRKKS